MTTEVKPTQDAIPPVLLVVANLITTAQQRDCEIAVRGLLEGRETEINQHTVVALSDFLEMLYEAETGEALMAFLCHARNRLTVEMTELPDSEQESLRQHHSFLTDNHLPKTHDSIVYPKRRQPEGGLLIGEGYSLMEWLISYLLPETPTGRLKKKWGAVIKAVNGEDDAYVYDRLRELRGLATTAPKAEQPKQDDITAQWFEQYNPEWDEGGFNTGEYVHRILLERDRAKTPQDFERSMVALAIATLLESKETPEPLCREIADAVIDMHDRAKIGDVLDPHNVREQFPLVLDALAADEPDEEMSESDKRTQNALQLGEHIAAILENPETPTALYNEIADVFTDLQNDTATVADDVRRCWSRVAAKLVASKSNPQEVATDE